MSALRSIGHNAYQGSFLSRSREREFARGAVCHCYILFHAPVTLRQMTIYKHNRAERTDSHNVQAPGVSEQANSVTAEHCRLLLFARSAALNSTSMGRRGADKQCCAGYGLALHMPVLAEALR